MKRTQRDVKGLSTWFTTYGIQLYGVQIQKSRFGSGIVATRDVSQEDDALLQVPAKLILSLDYVWKQAEKDAQLKEVLVALGEFSQTARGAILTFLLMQITATSPDVSTRVGIDNPWTTYVQFIPTEDTLPTFWSEVERKFADGTTLAPAIDAKLSSLEREFEHLQEAVSDIPWCTQSWFNPRRSWLSLDDWKLVDAMWRSRAMEIPSHGLCMVPMADMANHAHGYQVNSRTDVEDDTGDVRLVLDGPRQLESGQEIAITYGDEKGACEMVFSYGFLDRAMHRAESMFLNMEEPADDPLFKAKKHVFDCAPGFRMMYKMSSSQITWIGPFVWLMCINEEDGLGIKVVEQAGGGKRLRADWKGQEIKSVAELDDVLSNDENWDLFQLRAYSLVDERVRKEIDARTDLRRARQDEAWWQERDTNNTAARLTERLWDLEWAMLDQASKIFNLNISHFMSSRVVQRWLNGGSDDEDGLTVDTNYTEEEEEAIQEIERQE